MISRCLGSAFLVLGLSTAIHAQNRESLLQSLARTPGWEAVAEPVHFAEDQVEAFSPELAPSLKLYGVRGVTTQQWRSGSGTARVTLFEMVDSPAAYGFFTSRRERTAEPTSTLSGTESFRLAGRLYSWQSNYVTAIEGAADARDRLARVISERILGSSSKPTVAVHLPQAHIVPGSEKYLLSADAVDKEIALDRSKLGFDVSVEAASATYRADGRSADLLLLLYPTHHIAKQYAEYLESSPLMPAAFWKRDGPLVAIVYGSSDESLAKTILDGANHAYKITYDENANPVTEYAQIILTIFKLLGVVLVFSVVGGVAFAGLRIYVKSRYPDRVFDRYQDIEIIQLKLDQGLTKKELKP